MDRLETPIAYKKFLEECVQHPVILIEITSKCNFFCYYCISPNSPREKSFMGMDLYTHILDQVGDLTRDNLRLHIDGEPTIHPKFREMALMANARGHIIDLASNGSALRDELLDIQMNMRIYLSVNQEELAKRSKIKFDSYIRRLQNYMRAWSLSESRQNIYLSLYFDEDETLRAYKNDFAIRFLRDIGLYDDSQGDVFGYTFRKSNGYALCIERVDIAHGATHGGEPAPAPPPSVRGFCDSTWKTMAILQDGRIAYCCNDLTGSTAFTKPEEIWQSSLKDLWLSHPNITRIRDETLGNLIHNPLCQKCISSYGNSNRQLFMGWGPQFKPNETRDF